jgi:oligopeptide transport system substrate-binding protein
MSKLWNVYGTSTTKIHSGIIRGMPFYLRPFRIVSFVLFAASLSLLCLSGCSKRSQTVGPVRNTLRYCLMAEPTTFDPAVVQDETTIDVLQNVYEGLIQWNTDNKIAPAIAESWTVSPDGKTFTFKIRPGVKFHSGKVVTADDVAYSMARSLYPKLASPVALGYMSDIVGAADVASGKALLLAGVKVINPLTVSITISKPKAYWLNILTYPTAYILNEEAVDRDPDGKVTDQNEDGTGPFIISNYSRGESVDLKAFPGYWGGAPKIAGIHRPIVIDANTRHNLYTTDQIDIVDLSAGTVSTDENDPTLKDQIVFWPRAATYYIGLNQKGFPAFKDIRVRQAFAYATDKNKIIQLVFNGKRDVANDILPEGIVGHDPKFKDIPFEPIKAQQLLAAAGYPGGKGFPTVPIYYRESYPDLEKTVDVLRQMYQQTLGITVVPRRTEWATLLSMEDSNTLPCYHIRWAADYLDPQDYYSLLMRTGSTEDHTCYSNPKYDALCDAADIEQNPAKRQMMYRQAAAIAATDVPIIPLYYVKEPELVRPYVHHLDDSLMGHLPYKNLTLGP